MGSVCAAVPVQRSSEMLIYRKHEESIIGLKSFWCGRSSSELAPCCYGLDLSH